MTTQNTPLKARLNAVTAAETQKRPGNNVLHDDENNKFLLGVDEGKWCFYKETDLEWSQALVAKTHEDCSTDPTWRAPDFLDAISS